MLKAQERSDFASDGFDAVIRAIPSETHRPGNTERILAASKEYSEAVQAVTDALERKPNFVLHHILPKERKPPESEGPAPAKSETA